MVRNNLLSMYEVPIEHWHHLRRPVIYMHKLWERMNDQVKREVNYYNYSVWWHNGMFIATHLVKREVDYLLMQSIMQSHDTMCVCLCVWLHNGMFIVTLLETHVRIS